MAKIERGRISGLYGMESHTAVELYAWADKLESQKTNPQNSDDPQWLQRWADKLRRLAVKKEKAYSRKNTLRKSK